MSTTSIIGKKFIYITCNLLRFISLFVLWSCNICPLTLTMLMWRIWWASNNASRWQMGFNLAFKGL